MDEAHKKTDEAHKKLDDAHVQLDHAKKKMEELERDVKKKLEKARRMVIKAKKGQMKSEDDLVIQSLAQERNFDPFAVLWYWLFFICSVGPLIIMSIFGGGAWQKSYT